MEQREKANLAFHLCETMHAYLIILGQSGECVRMRVIVKTIQPVSSGNMLYFVLLAILI